MPMKLFLGAALICIAVAFGSGVSLARTESFDDFPLWKDVPGRAFAKLGEGKLRHGTRWAAFASRVGQGRRGKEKPCISVASITDYGEYGAAHGCGAPAPAGNDSPPVMALMTRSRDLPGRSEGETIASMSFKPLITSIKLVTTKETIHRRTRVLNRYQQRKTHLPRVRYVALALEKDVCIVSISGYDADRDVAFEAPTGECESSAAAP